MFETTITEAAKKMFPHSEARFFNGTLFAEVTVPEAVKLETELLTLTTMGIIMSRVSKSTTAYDFV